METDRVEYAYAGWWFDNEDKAVSILIDTGGQEDVSSAAKKAVKDIVSKYPHAQVYETNDAGDIEE